MSSHLVVYILKEIKLTRGKVALVDDQDFEWLNQWKWFCLKSRNTYYAARSSRAGERSVRCSILMHREIAAIAGIPQVDHWDGDGLHNWRGNLRPVSNTQNSHNQRKCLGTSSRFKGVCWHKTRCHWEAYISVNGKRRHLGCFENETDAAKTYDAAAKEHFGEFALTNL